MRPWEEYQKGPWDDYQDPQNIPDDSQNIPDLVGAAAGGVNTLLPAIAGLPVDTVTAARNLGRMGYGLGRKVIGEKLLGETPVEAVANAPEIIDPSTQVGGSEWMKRKISEMMGVDPFSPPDPNDPLQKKIHMASSILAAGALSPAKGVKQLVSNVGRMTPPAAGAVTAQTVLPDEPLAPLVGMMAAPGGVTAARAVKQKVFPSASQAFMKANKLGYKVPPALAKGTKSQQLMEGTAGPVPTKQRASIYNQKITNNIIKKDIGYNKDSPLSPEGLETIRLRAGKVYSKAKKLGTFKTDKEFTTDLEKISKQNTALAKEFPEFMASPHGKQSVVDLVKMFKKEQISSEALVDAVKQLRSDAKVGFRSQDPSIYSLAKANSKMANALEGLMERSVKSLKPEFLSEFKSARQRIAKTYTIEKALKGENVDAVALGRELDKGKPISGAIKDVAEFGQNFKGAAQVNPPQMTNFRPADILVPVAGAMSTSNPMWLLAMGARPALRTLLLSKPYQKMLARAKPEAIKRIMKLPERSQAGAVAALLDEFNSLENNSQKHLQ